MVSVSPLLLHRALERASLHHDAVATPRINNALFVRLFSWPRRDIAQQGRKLLEIALAWRCLAPRKPDLAFRLRRAESQQANIAAMMHLVCNGHLRQKRD